MIMPEQQLPPLEDYLYSLDIDKLQTLADKIGNTNDVNVKDLCISSIVETLQTAEAQSTAYVRLLDIVLVNNWEKYDRDNYTIKFLKLVEYVSEISSSSLENIDWGRIKLKSQLSALLSSTLQLEQISDVFVFLWQDGEEYTKLILKPKVSHKRDLYTAGYNGKTSDEDPKPIEKSDDIQEKIQEIINNYGVLPKIHIVTYWDFMRQYEIEKMKFHVPTLRPTFPPILRNLSVVFYCSWNFFCLKNPPNQVIDCQSLGDKELESPEFDKFYLVTSSFSEMHLNRWMEFVDEHPFFCWYSKQDNQRIEPAEFNGLLPIGNENDNLWMPRLKRYCHNNIQDAERIILAFHEEKNHGYITSIVNNLSIRKKMFM